MRKFWVVIVLTLAMLVSGMAYGEGAGIQVITPDASIDETSGMLDDLKIGTPVTLMDDCEIEATSCKFRKNIFDGDDRAYVWLSEKNEAQYLVLYINVLNYDLSAQNYLSNYDVNVIFNDKYQYKGQAFQTSADGSLMGEGNCKSIEPMYEGHYAFLCSLPNAIVDSTDPLRMEISFSDYTFTYNVR